MIDEKVGVGKESLDEDEFFDGRDDRDGNDLKRRDVIDEEMDCMPDLTKQDHDTLFFLAQFTDKCENFEDTRLIMRYIVQTKRVLNSDERALLALAYKNVVGKRRTAWRKLWLMLEAERELEQNKHDFHGTKGRSLADGYPDSSTIEGLAMENVDDDDLVEGSHHCISEFHVGENLPLAHLLHRVRDELEDLCLEMIELVKILLDNVEPTDIEAKVMYLKSGGDYFRYLSEYNTDPGRKDFIHEANVFYKDALELAGAHLAPSSPLRLSLALNIAVFYFEIMNTTTKACELAKTTYDVAVLSLENAEEENHKEAFMLLDLLRENLTIWTSSE